MTTMSNSLFAYYTKPVIVTFLSPLFFNEKPEFTSFVALTVSIMGLFFILTPSMIGLAFTDLMGILLVLVLYEPFTVSTLIGGVLIALSGALILNH